MTATFRHESDADRVTIRDLLIRNDLPVSDLDASGVRFIVAENEGVIAGVAGLEVYGADGLLRSVAVLPEGKNQGIGTQLVDQVIVEARRIGIESLHLLTIDAAGFFEKLGFRAANRSLMPESIRNTAEVRCICPESAAFMSMQLVAAPAVKIQETMR